MKENLASKIGTYNEDGWRARVKVLEDTSDKTHYRYKLEVLKTLEDSPVFISPAIGTVFDVNKKRTATYIWSLCIERDAADTPGDMLARKAARSHRSDDNFGEW